MSPAPRNRIARTSLFRADEVGLAEASDTGEVGTMQRSCLEPIDVPKDPSPRGEPLGELSALERAARIADVKERMASCLEELDRLQLVYPANHLCHAIETMEDPS